MTRNLPFIYLNSLFVHNSYLSLIVFVFHMNITMKVNKDNSAEPLINKQSFNGYTSGTICPEKDGFTTLLINMLSNNP